MMVNRIRKLDITCNRHYINLLLYVSEENDTATMARILGRSQKGHSVSCTATLFLTCNSPDQTSGHTESGLSAQWLHMLT